MMKTKKYSTRRLEAIRTPANASQYIAHIDDLEPGLVVLYCRESRCHHNLEKQAANLNWEFEIRGHDVIAVFKEEASADAEDRIKLKRAALTAKEAGAVLGAEATNRFVRGFRFKREDTLRESGKPRRIAVSPNALDWERFLDLVHGAKLATLWHPDLSEKEVRGLQTKRGQAGRPTGPMTKKRRRELKLPEALKLREDGLSLRKIARALSVPWPTVRDWIEDARDFSQIRAVES